MSLPNVLVSSPLALALLVVGASAQSTELASVDSNGVQANDEVSGGSISSDGRYVIFYTGASNLVPGDTNGVSDTFLHDRGTGTTERISVASSGAQANGGSGEGFVSADGRWVAFESGASNLVANDTNYSDIFMRDRATGTTTLVSVGASGAQANYYCENPAMSSDGRYVAFESWSTNLVPGVTSFTQRVFVRDLVAGTTVCASVDSSGVPSNDTSGGASMSGDGRYVVFESYATNLIPCCDSTNWDIFFHDLLLGTTTRITNAPGGGQPNYNSYRPRISLDGRYVVFDSGASNLVPGDANGKFDVFVNDTQTGVTKLVSVDAYGAQGNSVSTIPWISSDGRFVAFASDATNLVPNDINGARDVFVHDMQTGGTWFASVGPGGVLGNSNSSPTGISADGRFVSMTSDADNLVPGDVNGHLDELVRDRGTVVPGYSSFCFGEGSLSTPCPCANFGASGHGCANSVNALGARVVATGSVLPDLVTDTDTIVLSASGMPANATSIYLQGSSEIANGAVFGDGLRCAGGMLLRLAVKVSSMGASQYPEPGDMSVSQRGGITLGIGASYAYQTYYRDSNLSFCPDPPGNSWNVTNGIRIVW